MKKYFKAMHLPCSFFVLFVVVSGILVRFISHSVVIISRGCVQTLAELKEEESFLLKERRNLKNVCL